MLVRRAHVVLGLLVSPLACFVPPEASDIDESPSSTGGVGASSSSSGDGGESTGADALQGEWSQLHAADHDDGAAGIAVGSDGVYVCGTQDANNAGGQRTGVVLKYGFEGDVIWTAAPIAGNESFCRGIVVGSDDRPVIAAMAWTSQWEAHVLKLGAERGEEIWGRSYVEGSDERFFGIGIAPNDDVVPVGNTFVNEQTDLLIQRYAPDGTPVWTATPDVFVFDRALGAAVSAAGHVYVVGTADDNAGTLSGVLFRFEGSSGAVDWFDVTNSDGAVDLLADVVVDGDEGTPIVLGHDLETGVITLREHDLGGGVSWTQHYAGGLGQGDIERSLGGLAIGTDDTLYFAGTASGETSEVWVRGFDTHAGADRWATTLEGLGGDDIGRDLVVGGSSNLYVVGEIDAERSVDIGTFRVPR